MSLTLNEFHQIRMALSFGWSADVEPGPGGGIWKSRPDEVDLVGWAVLGYE